jgi:thioredoxin-related protein
MNAKKIAALVLLLLSAVSCSRGSFEWLDNIEDAQKIAAETGRSVLVNFTGSDWCSWCKQLEAEVFGTDYWQKSAPEHFVMVSLDFPQEQQQSEETRAYNQAQSEKYFVRGFPTIMILDSDGAPLAQTGYQQGGAEAYMEHVLSFLSRAGERDALLSELAAAEVSSEQLAILEKLVNLTGEWGVGAFYPDFKTRIIALDADNAYGLKEKYELDLEIARLAREHSTQDDLSGFKTALLNLEKNYRSAESRQLIYYYLAIVARQEEDEPEMKQRLRQARDFAPESALGKQIATILEQL